MDKVTATEGPTFTGTKPEPTRFHDDKSLYTGKLWLFGYRTPVKKLEKHTICAFYQHTLIISISIFTQPKVVVRLVIAYGYLNSYAQAFMLTEDLQP